MTRLQRLCHPAVLIGLLLVGFCAWKAGGDPPITELAKGDPTMTVCPEGAFRPEVITCFYTRHEHETRLNMPDPRDYLRGG